jgi:hypothetical protein
MNDTPTPALETPERTPLEKAQLKVQLAKLQNIHPATDLLTEEDLEALPPEQQRTIRTARQKRARRSPKRASK